MKLFEKKQQRHEYTTIYNSLPNKKTRLDENQNQNIVSNPPIVITAQLYPLSLPKPPVALLKPPAVLPKPPVVLSKPPGKIPIPTSNIGYPTLMPKYKVPVPPLIPLAWFIPLIKY